VLPWSDAPGLGPHDLDPLQVELWERHRIEVPVMRWRAPRVRLLRISPQIYNQIGQYEMLAAKVSELLATASARS
jgi:isopenicillin-N epimerase